MDQAPSQPVGTPRCLIIADGTVATVVAAWIEGACRPTAAETGAEKPAATLPSSRSVGPLLWRPAGLPEAAHAGVAELAERCHASAIVDGGVAWGTTGLAASALLLAAGEEAVARGIERVIWPVQFAGELTDDARLTRVTEALDRSLLAGRLLSVDAPSPGLVIETPLVELTDVQLLDLAGDTDAPLSCAAWQVTAGQGASSGEADRWRRAMVAAGIVPAIAGLSPVVVRGGPGVLAWE